MRPLEITLAVILAIRIAMTAFRRRRWHSWASFLSLGVLVLQVGMEGYRWQMIPLYAITFGISLIVLWRLSQPQRESAPRAGIAWLRTAGGFLLLGLSLLPPILLPVPSTPAPTGPHPVGTVSLMLVDDSRRALYSQNPDEPRAIMLQVWYPADSESVQKAKRAPWMEEAEDLAPAIAKILGLPAFSARHLRYATSHAYADIPPAKMNSYPLLLFSHGWRGFRTQNSYQMEELASHGYVVAAPDHTYGAVMTVFPTDEAIPYNPDALPYQRDLSDEDYKEKANQLVTQWAGDLSFIIDVLASGENLGGPLKSLSPKLDVEHVGVLGHSTGGGAIVEFCARDSRCQAGFGMDTYLEPVSEAVLASGLEQPFLFMYSQAWPSADNLARFERLYAQTASPSYRVDIDGTAHYDFTDLPAFSPLAAPLGFKGPLDGERVLTIIRAYSVAFFDRQLRNQADIYLKGIAPAFMEVTFEEK